MSLWRPPEFATHPAPFPEPATWRGVCREVVDGDTYTIFIDQGFLGYCYERIRLRGCDTPEIFHPKTDAERQLGFAAKARAEQLLLNQPVRLTTHKDERTFERWVADVEYWAGTAWVQLAATLVAEKLTKADVPV